MRYPKRSQYKYATSQYRVRKWAEYEAGLQERGALTVWLSEAALEAWRAPATGRPGGKGIYSDLAIEAALTIRMVARLPRRQTEGFLRSLAEILGLGLSIPDHTTIPRRLKRLGALRSGELAGQDPIHLLIDSTGSRVHVRHLRRPPTAPAWSASSATAPGRPSPSTDSTWSTTVPTRSSTSSQGPTSSTPRARSRSSSTTSSPPGSIQRSARRA